MYIFELINKVLKEKKAKSEENGESQETEKCEHLFVPTDSTGETLACSKCGMLVKKRKRHVEPFNQNMKD